MYHHREACRPCHKTQHCPASLRANPDVAGDLRHIRIDQEGEDRVHVIGVTGSPPPPTTKAMIAARGGYQAEAVSYINGLYVEEKTQMMRHQLVHMFKGNNFSKLSVERYGSPVLDQSSQ